MVVECPQCGHTNEPGEDRCAKCGINLEWALERGSKYWLEDTATRHPLILASEDEPGLLMIYSMILEPDGYRIAMASDPFATIELAERFHPDLIITDFMKPYMNGAEMVSRLKSNPALRDIPVILITAGNDYWRVSRAVAAGVTRWLHKPFKPPSLITVVASVLSGDFLPLVLLVHDKTIRQLPQSLVENFRILKPTPHEEIFRGARQLNPDLIVIGVDQSGRTDGSGMEILAELKASDDTRNIPVVMWADELEPGLDRQAIEIGAHTVYTGPPDGEALAEVLRSVLGE